MSTSTALQDRCELAQEHLLAMRYLQAERILEEAEKEAWQAGDWDTLSRLYMPLQEARRQRRQRCGEGMVCLDVLAESPGEILRARHIVDNYPHGQLLVAGWGTFEPAAEVRRLAREHELYVETFLAAVQPADDGLRVTIAPTAGGAFPPPHSVVVRAEQLPRGARRGDAATYGFVMDLWERLHRPFLAEADAQTDPVKRMEGYRKAIEVDYACELAHQKLSDTARAMLRRR